MAKSNIKPNYKNIFTYNNIFCTILIIFLFYLLINNNNNNHSNFDDTIENTTPPEPPTTTLAPTTTIPPNIRAYGPGGIPSSEKPKACSTTDSVLGFCIEYDSCCSGSSSTNCICTNPIVSSCKKLYDECMSDTNTSIDKLRTMCGDKNKECCSNYKYSSDTSLFNEKIVGQQKDNVLCDINGIKNIDQKCQELCQTNPKCAAYSLTEMNCTLHNKATFKPEPKDPNNFTNFKVHFIAKK